MFVFRCAAAAFALVAALPAASEAPGDPILPVPLQPVVDSAHRTCASLTPSGLGYTALRPGSGAAPAATDLTLIAYLGYLGADGQVFDQNPQAVLPVGGVIPGFSEGLRMMPKGSIYRLCVPAALGYGAQGAGTIPANAALVFQVEMLDFRSQAEIDAMSKQQEAAEAATPRAE